MQLRTQHAKVSILTTNTMKKYHPWPKALSCLVPRLWNNLPADIKLNTNVNTLKHDIKKLFFDELQKKEDNIYISISIYIIICQLIRTS